MNIAVRDAIADFLGQHRIALIGVSRNPRHISRMLLSELVKRGYDVVPVNPNAQEIEGRRAFAYIGDVDPAPDGALLFTTGIATDQVVEECATAGVKRVWMYRATGKGAVTPSAVEFCSTHGLTVVPGECPFMFLSGAAWPHRVHHVVHRLFGGV